MPFLKYFLTIWLDQLDKSMNSLQYSHGIRTSSSGVEIDNCSKNNRTWKWNTKESEWKNTWSSTVNWRGRLSSATIDKLFYYLWNINEILTHLRVGSLSTVNKDSFNLMKVGRCILSCGQHLLMIVHNWWLHCDGCGSLSSFNFRCRTSLSLSKEWYGNWP